MKKISPYGQNDKLYFLTGQKKIIPTYLTTMPTDPNFNNHVFEVVRLIPAGRVTSYGAIAKFLGRGIWSRKVGYAMGLIHGLQPPVPYWRVVNSQGQLTGGTSGVETRAQLLAEEGVTVIGDKIQNFKTVFWEPDVEIDFE